MWRLDVAQRRLNIGFVSPRRRKTNFSITPPLYRLLPVATPQSEEIAPDEPPAPEERKPERTPRPRKSGKGQGSRRKS